MNWLQHQHSIQPGEVQKLRDFLANAALNTKSFCLFDSNQYNETNSQNHKTNYQLLAGIGSLLGSPLSNIPLEDLQKFLDANGSNWYFGNLCYELKDTIEPKLQSHHHNPVSFPVLNFFIPKVVVSLKNDQLTFWFTKESKQFADQFINDFVNYIHETSETQNNSVVEISIPDKMEYLKKIESIRYHLQRGDIYEMNYCIPFISKNISINPAVIWKKLSAKSPAPFSCFYRQDENWLMCASPERFIRKTGSKIISQPIKGTSKRSDDHETDIQLREGLRNNEKERAENVMIVDLVRNDLSRIAEKKSVSVDELFGIYAFPQVYQMISTISAELRKEITFTDILKALFPMGSMTGAPKIRAMELIEEHETFRRGIFSGSVGYISPDGDFDFNVVIRSILYNATEKTVLIPAGSAITVKSDAEMEYEECLLKAKAMLTVLGNEKLSSINQQ